MWSSLDAEGKIAPRMSRMQELSVVRDKKIRAYMNYKLLIIATALLLPISVSADELSCPAGTHEESVQTAPAIEGTPAITHTVHHDAITHTATVVDTPAFDEVIVDTPAFDETVIDVPAHFDYVYVGHDNGDYDNDNVGHNHGSYDHTTGHIYVYVGAGHGDYNFVLHSHHGDYNQVSTPAITHIVHHPAITHTVHHDAITHEETVIDTPAFDEVVVDEPGTPGTPATFENQCVADPVVPQDELVVPPEGNNGQIFCSGPTAPGWHVDLPGGGCSQDPLTNLYIQLLLDLKQLYTGLLLGS